MKRAQVILAAVVAATLGCNGGGSGSGSTSPVTRGTPPPPPPAPPPSAPPPAPPPPATPPSTAGIPAIFPSDNPCNTDISAYPVQANAPIEGGPNATGDRHVLVIDRTNKVLYEMGNSYPTPATGGWDASGGA